MRRVAVLLLLLPLAGCWLDNALRGLDAADFALKTADLVSDLPNTDFGKDQLHAPRPDVDPEHDPVPGETWMSAEDLNDIGIRYATGQGVGISTGRARRLWRIAVSKGSAEAAFNISESERWFPEYRKSIR